MQGDIFSGITIPGVGIEHTHAMVIAHPCVMRSGAHLHERIEMIPVVKSQKLRLDKWADGHYRLCPLPSLKPATPKDADYAARFDQRGMVESRLLTPDARIACLSEKGVLLLQQREVHNRCRFVVPLDKLEEASVPVLLEVELGEDWNEQIVPLHLAAGQALEAALRAEETHFDSFLKSAPGGGESLRKQLGVDHLRASVTRALKAEIKRRVS
jgi:hypothetical protein